MQRETAMKRSTVEFVREGNYDAGKIEKVRLALRRGDVKAAAKLARVFELLPLAP
jgi:hypothetical protein